MNYKSTDFDWEVRQWPVQAIDGDPVFAPDIEVDGEPAFLEQASLTYTQVRVKSERAAREATRQAIKNSLTDRLMHGQHPASHFRIEGSEMTIKDLLLGLFGAECSDLEISVVEFEPSDFDLDAQRRLAEEIAALKDAAKKPQEDVPHE